MKQWTQLMKTPSGLSIPVLTAIGNHETEGISLHFRLISRV